MGPAGQRHVSPALSEVVSNGCELNSSAYARVALAGRAVVLGQVQHGGVVHRARLSLSTFRWVARGGQEERCDYVTVGPNQPVTVRAPR